VKLFIPYHDVAWLWVRIFHRAHFIYQLIGMFSYEFVTRILVLSGLTTVFFHKSFYVTHPYIDGMRAREIAEARWRWFSEETFHRDEFPVSYDMMRASFLVPRCFDFNWMTANLNKLVLRLCLVIGLIILFLTGALGNLIGYAKAAPLTGLTGQSP